MKRRLNEKQFETMDSRLIQIAKQALGLETLKTRHSDRLDFHEHAVWQIEAALRAAYEAGRESK